MNAEDLNITIKTLEEIIQATKNKMHMAQSMPLRKHYDNLIFFLDCAKGVAIEMRGGVNG